MCQKKKKKTSPKIPFVRLSRTRRCGTFSICIIMFRLCRMIPRPDNRLARGSRRRRACVIARASEYCDIKINMQTPRSCASKNRRSFFFSFSALRFARTLRFRVYTSGGGAAPCISLSLGQTTLTTRKKKKTLLKHRRLAWFTGKRKKITGEHTIPTSDRRCRPVLDNVLALVVHAATTAADVITSG